MYVSVYCVLLIPTWQVLVRYDTLVVAHHLTSEAAEVSRKLSDFAFQGGRVVITASSINDIYAATGVWFGFSLDSCQSVRAGTTVSLSNGSIISEPHALSLCNLKPVAQMTVLARTESSIVAAEVPLGNGSILALAVGNYAMSTDANAGILYKCGVDEIDSPAKQPYFLAEFARVLLRRIFSDASLFNLGENLSW